MSGDAGSTGRSGAGGRRDPAGVRRAEWAFPLLVAAALTMIAWTPYAIAFGKNPASDRFMGVIGHEGIDDNNVYLGLMRQAADGRVLFTNNFTPEPNPPALFNLVYLVLGRLAGWTGWSLDFVHRLFGGFSIVLLVLVIYRFIAIAIRKPSYRRLALTLACFSMGFIWLGQVLHRLTGMEFATIDSWLVEMSVFHSMVVYPHFVFAAALMVGSLILLLRAEQTGRLSLAVGGGLCGAALAASHTFEVVVLLPAAVFCFLLDWMSRERVPDLKRWISLAAFGALPVPVLLLNNWTLAREPMWGNVVARLDFYTPSIDRVALGLGASFFIVLLTFDGFLRPNRSSGVRMAKAWLIVALALAYFPKFNWRFHLLNGIQIPLAILATQGLRRTAFLAILKRRRSARSPWWPALLRGRTGVLAVSGLVILVCCLSSVNILLTYCHEAGRVAKPTYLPKSRVAALEWMSREVPSEALILATYETGNYVPRLSGQRVFVGEDKLTEGLQQRQTEVENFFRMEWTDKERIDLLQRFGVDYVFHGDEERKTGPYDPSLASFLRPVHQVDDMRIYQVIGSQQRARGSVDGSHHGGGQP